MWPGVWSPSPWLTHPTVIQPRAEEGEVVVLPPLSLPSPTLCLPGLPSLLHLRHKSHGDSPIQPLGKGL